MMLLENLSFKDPTILLKPFTSDSILTTNKLVPSPNTTRRRAYVSITLSVLFYNSKTDSENCVQVWTGIDAAQAPKTVWGNLQKIFDAAEQQKK